MTLFGTTDFIAICYKSRLLAISLSKFKAFPSTLRIRVTVSLGGVGSGTSDSRWSWCDGALYRDSTDYHRISSTRPV